MFNRLKNAYHNVSPYVFTRNNTPAITGALLLTGAGIITSLGTSYTFGQAVNTLYSGEPAAIFGVELSPYAMIVVSGAIYTANNIISSLREWLLTPLGPRVSKALVVDHVSELMKKELAFHQSTPFGTHVTRFNKCFTVGTAVTTQLFVKIIPPMLDMGVAIGFLSTYGTEIGIGLGGVVATYMGYNLTTRNEMVTLREDTQQKGFKSFEVAMQEIKEYKTVHDFNNLSIAMKRIEDSLSDAVEAEVKSSSLIPKAGTLQAMISGVGYTGLCLLAGRRVMSHQLGASDYAFIGSLAVQFLIPLNGLATAMNQVTTSIPDIEAVFDDFKKIPEAKDPYPEAKLVVDPSNARIEMKNMSFHYDERKPVLKNISCMIEAGKKIGIVGTTGGGKSTLLNLLLRFYDLASGEILINGQDISKVSLQSLRKSIGIVPQMPVLFNDTLYNNIAYGGLMHPAGVRKEDVEAAVDAACLREFVNALPDKLNTMVGEGGAKISGGQRQRIAIARVILKNPSIVILDEATSALDSETEKEIQASLDTVFKGKTVLAVAHRLETIKNSDCILVFDKGEIVESGTHQQLLNKNGVYAHLQPKTSQQEEKKYRDVSHIPVVFHLEDSATTLSCVSEVSERFYTNANAPRGYKPTIFNQKPVPTIQNSSIESKDVQISVCQTPTRKLSGGSKI